MDRPVRLLLVLLLLAGCVAPAAQPEEGPDGPVEDARGLPFPDPMAQEPGHDHSDVEAHAHAYRFEQTAHHPLAGSASASSGAHALVARNGWLFAAAYGGEAGADGGFFVFDVRDPASPKETGRFRFAGPLGGDRSISATPDADFVVLGTESLTCAGHVNPFAPGMYLVDVRDKANPKVAHFVPDTGVHSVSVHRIGGEDYVFAVMGGDNIFRIDRTPVPRLTAVGQVGIGHDSMVMDDPLLGVPVLYAANGAGDFVMYDVSSPAQPKQLAAWAIPDRGDRYYVHTGAVQVIDGRRIVVISSEDWGDYPSALWIVDATDLGFLETVAQWSAPGEHAAEGLRFSMHNPRFTPEGVLILAYYHGGVWALDLSTPQKREQPPVVGHFMPGTSNGWKPQPTRTSAVSDSLCGKFNLADAPVAFDVEVYEGVVYVADLPTGLYTLRPGW